MIFLIIVNYPKRINQLFKENKLYKNIGELIKGIIKMSTNAIGQQTYNKYLQTYGTDFKSNVLDNSWVIPVNASNYGASSAQQVYPTVQQPVVQPYAQQPAATTPTSAQTGEKDDGKIGFSKAALNVGKGVVNFFKGMVCDETGSVSGLQIAKTIGIGALIGAASFLIPGAGAAIVLGFLGLGLGHTAVAAYDIATAKTDAEDEQAWQNLGSGLTEATLAYVGCKKTGAFKKAGKVLDSAKGSAGRIYDSYKAGGIDTAKHAAASEFKAARTTISDQLHTSWETAKNNWKSLTDKDALNLKDLERNTKKSKNPSVDREYNKGVQEIANKNQADALKSIEGLQKAVRDAKTDAARTKAQAKLDGAVKAYNESVNHRVYESKASTARIDKSIERQGKNVNKIAQDLAKEVAELEKNPKSAAQKAKVNALKSDLAKAQDELSILNLKKNGIQGPGEHAVRYTSTKAIRNGYKNPATKWITLAGAGRGSENLQRYVA